MRKTSYLIVLIATLLAGLALAQTPPIDEGDNYEVDINEADVTQTITLSIPPRVAIHISETSWSLDLGNIDNSNANVPRPEGCYMVPKNHVFPYLPYTSTPTGILETAQHTLNLKDIFVAARGGTLDKMAVYPAVDGNNNGRIDGNGDKGGLVCLNYKIVQKFCNVDYQATDHTTSCELDVKFYEDTPVNNNNYGQFFIYDKILGPTMNPASNDDENVYSSFHFLRSGNITSAVHLEGGDRFLGWQDDLFYEGFYFDGSEVADTFSFKLRFTVSAQF